MTTLSDITEALRTSWSEATSADSEWSPDNPARGQCAVSALVVQDYFGGTLLRCVMAGESHYFNRLPDGSEIDLTKQQFSACVEAEDVIVRDREYVLSFPATVDRYDILRASVAERLLTQMRISWTRVKKTDLYAVSLADRHYSRRKVGSPQFMPPGQTVVLTSPGAVFGWWRPHPSAGITQMNGLSGWTCTIFRNESPVRSSLLILLAEEYLYDEIGECGPDGMITYVWDKKVASVNPGYCFKKADWKITGRSADGKKTLLQKPFWRAGMPDFFNFTSDPRTNGAV